MVWVTPITFVSGPLPASQLNMMLDNMNELGPAQATEPGQVISVGSTDGAIAPYVGAGKVLGGYASPEFEVFTDGGQVIVTGEPSVFVPAGYSHAMVLFDARLRAQGGVGSAAFAPFPNLFGSPSSIRSTRQLSRRTGGMTITTLAGSPTTIQMHYGISSSASTSGVFAQRRLTVIPLGKVL